MPAPTRSQRFLDVVRRALCAPDLGLRPGARILCACSGGPDSTALLLSLSSLQGELCFELHVVYVDHGLRPESAAEGAWVADLAAQLELPAEVVAVQVPERGSRMAAARQARYAALCQVAERVDARLVAVGHTASDQAETVLMRWLGGAGLRGLCGMAPSRPLPYAGEGHAPPLLLRPLLGLSRTEVQDFLADAGVAPLDDPTNDNQRYLRTRLRHGVLPLLRAERKDLDRHVFEVTGQLRADAMYLDQLAADALRRLSQRAEPGRSDGLPVTGLLSLPAPVATRVIALAAAQALPRAAAAPLSYDQVLAVLALCRQHAGSASLDLPEGLVAERRYDRLHFQPRTVGAPDVPLRPPTAPADVPPNAPPNAPPDAIYRMFPGPGSYPVGEATLELSVLPPGHPAPAWTSVCAGWPVAVGEQPFPLCLRPLRPGDRIRLSGGRRKVSDVLIDAKIPRSRRAALLVLALARGPGNGAGPPAGRQDDVLWIVGVRAAVLPPPDARQESCALLVARWVGSGE